MAERAPEGFINFDNIPGNIISGLSATQVEELARRSMDVSTDGSAGDVTLNEDQIDFLRQLENESIPSSTASQTKRHIDKFRKFLISKELTPQFEEVSNTLLNDYLRLFYASLTTKHGALYSPSSLICIRAAIQRHLTSPDVNKTVNIIHGDEFQRSNGVLRSMIGRYLKSNQERKKEYEAIKEVDMEKIKQYFNRSTLEVLQEEVIFNIMFHFGLRGRENLRALTFSSIEIKLDGSDRHYGVINVPLLSKNVKASLNAKEHSDLKQARMYAENEKSTCPLEALILYKKKFESNPKAETPLFLKCSRNGLSKIPIGKTVLGDFMKQLSRKLHLSTEYTNHCIRVTVVTVMRENKVSNKSIMLVTGHKNPTSVERYDRIRRDDDFRLLSGILHSSGVASDQNSSSRAVISGVISDQCSTSRTVVSLSKECKMHVSCHCANTNASTSSGQSVTEGRQHKKARLVTSWGSLEIDL